MIHQYINQCVTYTPKTKIMKKITFIIITTFCTFSWTFAQVKSKDENMLFGKSKPFKAGTVIRCATTEYEEHLKLKNPSRLSTDEFEQWILPKLEQNTKNKTSKNFKTNAVITIPVVVHVISDGDAVGVNENIFDQQVLSQIKVLNEDFRKKSGTPGFNTNPVGADIEIEFELANKDPNGIASSGIDRVNLGAVSWSTDDIDAIVKPQTQWNPDKYFNIWVVNLTRTDLLGYAQFPGGSGLSGLSSNEGDSSTDGVVIGYKYFGSSTYFANGTYRAGYDKGRTTTHEVGHWLGLRHIWGDAETGTDGCTVDDYCADTPNAANENQGCPSNVDSCPDSPGVDMVENYMDYTNDACMNIFTNDQKARMITVMNNSVGRKSLKTSDAFNPKFSTDAGISIVSLNTVSCGNTFTPVINIVNKGVDNLTAATIRYGIDNTSNQILNWTGSLATNQSQDVTLNALTTTGGNHIFSSTIISSNSKTDENTVNDSDSKNFDIVNNFAPTALTFTLQCDYFGKETTWKLTNSNGTILYTGGPYSNTPKTSGLPTPIQTTFNLDNNDCYTFTIDDSEGDGICCDYGEGYYKIETPTGTTVIAGGQFPDTDSKSFRFASLSTPEIASFDGIKLYPNPTTDFLNLFVENDNYRPDSYTIINTVGQVLKSKKIATQDNLQINVASLPEGMYFLKLSKKGTPSKTIQFIKK
jgi:hypothetical protein